MRFFSRVRMCAPQLRVASPSFSSARCPSATVARPSWSRSHLVPVFSLHAQRMHIALAHMYTYTLGHVGPLGPSLLINGLLVPGVLVGPTLHWDHTAIAPLAQWPRTAVPFPAQDFQTTRHTILICLRPAPALDQ
jgi:hypothetical protein